MLNRCFLTPAAAVVLATAPLAAQAQTTTGAVGIGTTTPNAKAALDISATGKGLLIPRMDSASRAGIGTPPDGLMVFQTDGRKGFWYAMSGAWLYIPDKTRSGDNLGNHTATQGLKLNGNALSNNGTGGLRIDNTGQVGLGTPSPTQRLDLRGNLRLGDDGNGVGPGQAIEWVGPGVSTDPVGIYRLNPNADQSELRVVVGDVADPNDKFVVGRMGGTSAEGGIPGGTFTPNFSVRANGSVGIGTDQPAASLDVRGGLVLAETTTPALTGASPAYTIPANTSLVRLLPGATAPTGTIALSSTGPVNGQQLSVYNGTTIGATLGGQALGAGAAANFVYTNGNWRLTGSPGDNLGNHTATQPLNLNGQLLVSGGTATAGLGMSSDGRVVIGATAAGASPAASAALDVSSTSKGLLPPRMTQTQRNAIAGPALGLLVVQTDGTPGLYQYASGGWAIIANGAAGPAVESVSNPTMPVTATTLNPSTTNVVYADNANTPVVNPGSPTTYTNVNGTVTLGSGTPGQRLVIVNTDAEYITVVSASGTGNILPGYGARYIYTGTTTGWRRES